MKASVRILVGATASDDRSFLEGALAAVDRDFQVHYVEELHLAISALVGGDYDCALFDSRLQVDGNADILAELKTADIKTPIVLLTQADGEFPDVEALVRHGVVRCLSLPDVSSSDLALTFAGASRIARAERHSADSTAKLTRKTLYDNLSELPNRELFFDRLDQVIALARREQRQIAVLTMDLNGFKQVNATLGHYVGDKLLQEVATRIRDVARDSDTVARLGGDEFAQVMPTGATVAGAIRAAEKAIDALRTPIDVDGHHLATGISIGIAVFPLHGEDSSTLMRHADTAMYAAKRNATGYAVHSGDAEEIDEGAHVRKLSLSGDLRHAIEQQQLSLNYQPKVSFESSTIAGAEALLRWNHPVHGFVSPEIFIPMAEQTGIIEQLTTWVLDAALKQHSSWAEQGMFVPIAVNLSPITLHEQDFANQVQRLLRKWDVPSKGLTLEITESAIMSDVARATETVNQLHDMGLKISIDDFGTGYTSLSYIRRLPVSEIKVDKSFVLNMRDVNDDAVIVRSIVELGHNLGLAVVAEGIEDQETWDLLSDLSCNQAQGYFISKPVLAEEFYDWVQDSKYSGRN
jgi:diguanylate cyclase (GGDEF)-like protein